MQVLFTERCILKQNHSKHNTIEPTKETGSMSIKEKRTMPKQKRSTERGGGVGAGRQAGRERRQRFLHLQDPIEINQSQHSTLHAT